MKFVKLKEKMSRPGKYCRSSTRNRNSVRAWKSL